MSLLNAFRAVDREGDAAEPAEIGRVGVEDVDAPALLLGVALVHAVEVGGKQGGFLTAGGGVDLDDHVALVVGVFGQEGDAESLGQVGEAGFNVFQFELGHFDQFGVAALGDEGAEVGLLFDEAVALHVDGDQVFQAGAFAIQFAQVVRNRRPPRVGPSRIRWPDTAPQWAATCRKCRPLRSRRLKKLESSIAHRPE